MSRHPQCNAHIEDFTKAERDMLCPTCSRLGAFCLGNLHPSSAFPQQGPSSSSVFLIKIENEENGKSITEKVLVDANCEVTPLLLRNSDIQALDLVPLENQPAVLGANQTLPEMSEYRRVKVTLRFNDGEEILASLNPTCFKPLERDYSTQMIVGENARILGNTALCSLGLKLDYAKNRLVKII